MNFGSIRGAVRSVTPGQGLKAVYVIGTAQHEPRTQEAAAADGSFSLDKLKPGKWTITAGADGMLSQSRTVIIKAGQSLSIDFVLEDTEPADVLQIKDTRNLNHPRLPADTTFIDKNIIQDYKSGNSLRDIVGTAPGISLDSFGNTVVRGEHNTLNYVLDDVVLPEAVGQLQMGQVASPHSLESVQITTGGYDATAGGGPMGAIINLRSMPIQSKPTLEFAAQLGGPMQGGGNYYASTALSQDSTSKWNRVRVESSGQIFATKLGIEPPTRHFTRAARLDINILNRVEWTPTDHDRFRLTAAINENWLHIPTSYLSRAYGFKQNQHDRQNYIILSHRHTYRKWLDESNLHLVTGFYSQKVGSINTFNPDPIINGEEQGFVSASPTAKRYNFVFSAQGDVRKTVCQTHHLKAGFLSEIRPVRTYFSSFYYDANPSSGNYGLLISPFTGVPNGPQLLGNVGKYRGFRYLQSAYLQDTWTPQKGFLHRLTVDAGVRFDLYHGVFGNTRNIANAIAPFTAPGLFESEEAPAAGGEGGEGEAGEAAGPTPPPVNNQILMKPFQTNRVTNAQVSARLGAAFKVSKTLVARASFADLFTPPPVDLLARPFNITEPSINGIYNGSLRPMQASRGFIIDSGLDQQVGSRFEVKGSLFYKRLHNQGDELPVNNTLLYQRLTLSSGQLYGVESRLELKPAADHTGFFGFLSNTVSVAKLGGNHKVSGGLYDIDPFEVATGKYIDHDRRLTLTSAVGYRSRRGWWILGDLNYWTGFLNGLDPALFGAHPARTKPVAIFGLNVGYDLPAKMRKDKHWVPQGIDVRIQNIADNIVPINLGSVFQGTRYTLPLRVLVQSKWAI